jgi:DNA polymerase III alpha subunit
MSTLLRCVSHFSFLTGLLSPRELVELAVRQEMAHVGLCDWGGLYGHPLFAQEAARAGLHAVFGVELGEGRERVVVLARNTPGYRRLCRMVSGYRLAEGSGRAGGADGPSGGTRREGSASLLRRLLEREAEDGAAADELFVLSTEPGLLRFLRERFAVEALRIPVPPLVSFGQGSTELSEAGRESSILRESRDAEGDEPALDPSRRKVPDPEPPRSRSELLGLCEGLGIRGVAAPPIYYGTPAQRALHRLAVAVKLGRHVARVTPDELAPKGACLPSRVELQAAYADAPELLEEAERVARACTLSLAEPRPLIFPRLRFDLAGDADAEGAEPEQRAFEMLRARADSGFLQRYGRSSHERARARLQHELAVIAELGFASYFLVVDEIVGLARERDIPVLGRGSAADSLVAHCLGFTQADPLAHDLCFERFLNVERFRVRMHEAGQDGSAAPRPRKRGETNASWSYGCGNALPDIDLDFCWRRRDELIEAVIEHFGEGNVALLATQPSLGFRAAYREVLRAHGYSMVEVDRRARGLPRQIPEESLARARSGDLSVLDAIFERAPELRRRLRSLRMDGDERAHELALFRGAFGLTGAQRYLGLHPGGTVLAPDALEHYAPLERAAKGVPVVQWDKHVAPHMGLVKIDLLGNRGLSVYQDAQRELIRIGGSLPEPLRPRAAGAAGGSSRCLETDARTREMLRKGQTLGCWLLESPGMRALLTRMQAETVEDVIQSVALIRPGPAGSGMMDRYIRHARGVEDPPALPPELGFLRKSYGVLLYQEDVIRALAALCDVSLGQADLLRRKLGDRDGPGGVAARRFYEQRCAERGIDRELAGRFWGQIERFAAFSFCKAHSVSYGLLAWRLAVLLAHRPATVIAALLANGTGYYDRRVYVDEAKRRGIPVLAPCVHRSAVEFRAEMLGSAGSSRAGLRVGLGEVRELPTEAAEAVVREREEGGPFFNVEVFVQRLRRRAVTLPETLVERLILLGAFDLLEGTRPEKLWRYRLGARGREEARARLERGEAELESDGRITPRSLFPDALLPKAPIVPCLPEFSEEERARFEMEWLGFTTALHPLEMGRGALRTEDLAALPLAEAPSHVGREVQIQAWLAAMRRHRARPSRGPNRGGGWMCFLTFEDETGMLEVVLFPDVYRRFGAEISGQGRYRVRGRIESREGAVALHASALEALEP